MKFKVTFEQIFFNGLWEVEVEAETEEHARNLIEKRPPGCATRLSEKRKSEQRVQKVQKVL